jgi:hypothetical protein
MQKVSPVKNNLEMVSGSPSVIPYPTYPAQPVSGQEWQSVAPASAVLISAATMNPSKTLSTWDIGLCDCGVCWQRMFVLCCPIIALASARSTLDGSPICFNLFCVHPLVTIWLIHSAYGIPCTTMDIIELWCFGNCYINRVFQTVMKHGNPNPNFRGVSKNTAPLNDPCCPTCTLPTCCASFWCPCCYSAYKLKQHIDMPMCLGLLFTCPWTAQNILRYQYGVQGSDTGDECILGCFSIMCYPCAFLLYPVISSTKGLLVIQSCEKQGTITKRYLSTMPKM